MKIRKVGRERPVLYRGKFQVPKQVISRLAIAKTHLTLAAVGNPNMKVDSFYLSIDNILSAVIIAKESALTTTNHREKINKFFRHLKRRAKIRLIEQDDFNKFYRLWLKSRYKLYLPTWTEVFEMKIFTEHLFDFVVTELARVFKSDETILHKEINKLLKVFLCESVLEESEYLLQAHQYQAELAGDMYGDRLARKLLNPWNFIDVSLLTDSNQIANDIDKSDKIKGLLRNVLKAMDELVMEIQLNNLKRLALEIARAKVRKRQMDEETALSEAIEAAREHPALLKFRLTFNFNYDSSEPKETLGMLGKIIFQSIKNESFYKVMPDFWEALKLSKTTSK